MTSELICERCQNPTDRLIGASKGKKWCEECSYPENTHSRANQPRWCGDCGLYGDHTDDCSERCLECGKADRAHDVTCSSAQVKCDHEHVRRVTFGPVCIVCGTLT